MRLSGHTRDVVIPPAAVAVRAAAVVAVLAACLGGCRGLDRRADRGGPAGLETPATVVPRVMAVQPTTIPVELSFVRFDAADPVISDELWDGVDEQSLPIAVRRSLAANGLRCGIVTGDLPPHVAERLAATPWDGTAHDGVVPGTSRQTLRLLPGRRADVVTATPTPELIVLHDDGDGTHGETFRDGGGYLEIRGWPAGGGRVRLEITPEIRHGPVRRSWVGEEGRFRIEAGQARHRFEQLRVTVEVPDGGLLLVGPGGDASATVGDALFGDRAGGGPGVRQLLALRPLAPGIDPAFGGDPAGRED